MKKTLFFLLVLNVPATAFSAEQMALLNDEELSGVSARQGIALNFEMLINATLNASGEVVPDNCPTSALVASGTPDCRFALQFNGIDDAWLVVKEYYGVFKLNEVHVDGVRTQDSVSGYCDAACQERFGMGFDPDDRPAIQLSYDHSDLGSNTAFYNDAEIFLNAGKVAAEFNQSDPGGNIIVPGYLRNETPASAIGLKMADGVNGSGGPAQLRFDGNMMMYGY